MCEQDRMRMVVKPRPLHWYVSNALCPPNTHSLSLEHKCDPSNPPRGVHLLESQSPDPSAPLAINASSLSPTTHLPTLLLQDRIPLQLFPLASWR